MAGVKGRSGRPKGRRNKPKAAGQPTLRPSQPRQPVGVARQDPPANPPEDTSLSGKLKSMFSVPRILEVEQPRAPAGAQNSQGVNPSETTSSGSGAFEHTASRIESEYASDGGGSEPPRSVPAAGTVIPPPVQYVTDATVERFLRSFFGGMQRVHGDHWELSDIDYGVIVPVNTNMLNEQIPKLTWFANSENKALWVWVAVMSVFLLGRSTAGAKFLEWIMDKIVSLGGAKAEGTTKTESPESTAS